MAGARVSLGVRVKSGVARAVAMNLSVSSPQVALCSTLDLCDAAVPGSRQPYHALMQIRGPRAADLEARLRAVVRDATHRSVQRLLDDAKSKGLQVVASSLVVGSTIDPARIANEHIRAHALEGQLFRIMLVECFRSHRLPCGVFVEKEIFGQANTALGKSTEELKRVLTALGRGGPRPWRADEKLATLGALLASRASPSKAAVTNDAPAAK
jgi:hypothetical protein